MFTNENHEDDSSLSVYLTSNNQIHEITVSETAHQLHDYIIPLFNAIHVYDEIQFVLIEILQPGTSDKKLISIHISFDYNWRSLSIFLFINMDNREVDELSDIGYNIHPKNGPRSAEPEIIIPP